MRWALAVASLWASVAAALAAAEPDLITARRGVLYHADGSEVALWGVNYEFNLSWEYRTYFQPLGIPLTFAALKQIADRDFEELATLRVQVVRVHLLPADFTDGNADLVETPFLQALDYLVAKCREKGIHTYLTLFNRMGGDYRRDSFAARVFGQGPNRNRERGPYVLDPSLQDAYEHYIGRLADRRNSYTGRRYAEEPTIALFDLMNEPEFPELPALDGPGYEGIRADWREWRDSRGAADDAAGFRRYRGERIRAFLDRSVATLRSRGVRQPIFWTYNWPGFLDGQPEIGEAARASAIDGVSFCLYPGQNDLPHPIDFLHLPSMAKVNYLPMTLPDGVDWTEVRRTRDAGKAIAVYEFETWCNDTAYLYPAMARLFRELGAQLACMWEYDPAVAAEYNQVASHFLNLRTSPAKAASFLVAGEVFRRYPRGGRLPNEDLAPEAFRFGPFGASYSENTSWFVGKDVLLYSRGLPADVATMLPPRAWRTIAGTGASPPISVTGDGLYLLEALDGTEGARYRLTLWPTAEVIADLWKNLPDNRPLKKIRLSDAPRQVTLRLFDWKKGAEVRRENGLKVATGSSFALVPGVYFLSRLTGP